MASPIVTDFVDEIIDNLDNDYQLARIERFWLGGTAGPSGGQGVRPGGYIGQLIQRMVAYDTTEAATLVGSGSLVDNLNHIRYNVATISGMISSGVASTFVELNDVPTSYVGAAGKIVSVKADETGLEFIVNSGGGGGSHVHGIARWEVASGISLLDLPDYASEIHSLTGNGLTIDPLTYTLTDYITITLDTAVVTTTVFTSQYILLSE